MESYTFELTTTTKTLITVNSDDIYEAEDKALDLWDDSVNYTEYLQFINEEILGLDLVKKGNN